MSTRRAWTTAEDDLLASNYRKRGQAWCVERLAGRTKNAVKHRARVIGTARPVKDVLRPSTPFIDAQIRAVYEGCRPTGFVTKLALRLGKPREWVSNRAAQLNLRSARIERRRWSQEEVDYADGLSHLCPDDVAAAMIRKGWLRSSEAIAQQRRIGTISAHSTTHFSATSLARFLGVAPLTILKLIRRGTLLATVRSERSCDHGVHAYIISEQDVAAAIVRHSTIIDVRRADGPWLIDLLARYGSLALVEADTKREQAIHLAALGKTNAEIAIITDSTPKAVAVVLSKARSAERAALSQKDAA